MHVSIEPKTKADQEKMSVGARAPRRGGPHLPGAHRRGDRPDRDLRHGRAPPRGDRRPHEARVQRRGRRRPPAGGLPRDRARRRQEGRGQVHPPDRRLGPVRRRLHRPRAGARARASTSSTRSRAAPSRPSSSPPSRRGSRRRSRRASRPATRWSTCAPRSSTASTTTRTPRRSRSRSPARWRSRRPRKRAKPVLLEPVMAVEVVTPQEFLGDVIGDLSRRRGRVEGQEPRGNAARREGQRAAVGDVRLRDRPALQHPGPGATTRCSSTATRKSPTTSQRRIVEHRTGEPVGAGA